MKKLTLICLFISFLWMMSGCSSKKEEKSLTIYSSHPLEFIQSIARNFENENQIRVDIIQSGTGEILEGMQNGKLKNGDIIWGGSYSSCLPFKDSFFPYRSKNVPEFSDSFKNVDEGITCFSDIPSVIMLNRQLLGDIEIKGYKDLLNPELKGKIAFANPMKSSSSWEHLVNILYALPPEDGWTYVEKLIENLDGKMLQKSKEVYEGVNNGQFAVGLTFEEGCIKYIKEESPIEVIYMEEGTVSTPDGVYILKESKNINQAKCFVDYITSKEVQQYMVSNLDRRTIRKDVLLPANMKKKSEINIINVDYSYVGNHKKEWLLRFESLVKQ